MKLADTVLIGRLGLGPESRRVSDRVGGSRGIRILGRYIAVLYWGHDTVIDAYFIYAVLIISGFTLVGLLFLSKSIVFL